VDSVPPVAQAWVRALARHDFDALGAVFDPAVQFRALTPGELVNVGNAAEAVACFQRWFGDKTDIEVVDEQAVMLVDRTCVRYVVRVRKNGQPYLIEQSLCGDLEDGKFTTLDLLCSGFRPEEVVAVDEATHIFDAGDLGCGSGLPREFRTRLTQIPVGHLLEVVTSDASAKEDLPSMARLMGHQVRSVKSGPDGKIRIRVERTK
jgi:TusA-related sulfurtransferase